MTEVDVWFSREHWPLHSDDPLPRSAVSENGMRMVLDVAHEGDELCEATAVMLHGLDRERQTAVCIMPRGHDTPHMPQSPRTVTEIGRLFVRQFGRAGLTNIEGDGSDRQRET